MPLQKGKIQLERYYTVSVSTDKVKMVYRPLSSEADRELSLGAAGADWGGGGGGRGGGVSMVCQMWPTCPSGSRAGGRTAGLGQIGGAGGSRLDSRAGPISEKEE